jgi:allophanate hydrolase subunit 2
LIAWPYVVTTDSNRIGIRLQGAPLMRTDGRELPSEPLQRGAVQVPASGQPLIMGPDHPTTGGYPVIATILADDWDLCAQLLPGDEISFQVA